MITHPHDRLTSDGEPMVTTTATFRPPTLDELAAEMRVALCDYARLPWWKRRRFLLVEAIDAARTYNSIIDALGE